MGDPWISELEQNHFHMLRLSAQSDHPQDAPVRCSREQVRAIIDEVGGRFNPYLMIRYVDQRNDLPPGPFYVELGNEPDLKQFGWTVEEYAAACLAARDAFEGSEYRLFVGVISNLDRDSLEFLQALPWKELPNWIGCSYHRYPVSGQPPWVGQVKQLFGKRRSREWEVEELRRIVGPRPIGVSEVGYNELEFSEAQAVEYFGWEKEFLEKTGHEFAIAYQAWDGPQDDTSNLGHYGFRDLETGRWKDQTRAWTGVADV